MTRAEERAPYLEPWIQWTNVHLGQAYREHGVFLLGEGCKARSATIWEILSKAGHRVWICGCMNSRSSQGLRGALLPDPWSRGAAPQPAEFETFHRFVRTHVQEHTRGRAPIAALDYAHFAAFIARHGLSAQTLAACAAQLLREKITPALAWRRACLLDRLQLDLFEWQYRRDRPGFSIFFSNSTAHLQHLYWRNMEPDQSRVKPSPADQRWHANAISVGYRRMDWMLLSQQPYTDHEARGGMCFYRVREFGHLLAFAGVTANAASPNMAEDFFVDCESEEAARESVLRLRALTVRGRALLSACSTGNRIAAGCKIHESLPADAEIVNVRTGDRRRFAALFYRVDGLKSGTHHPDGILWIRSPTAHPGVQSDPVRLESIAPTVLESFGLAAPPEMRFPPLNLAN